jgi:hypothetical protein
MVLCYLIFFSDLSNEKPVAVVVLVQIEVQCWYLPGGLKKTMKNLSQDGQSKEYNFKLGPCKYMCETGILTSRSWGI